MLPSLYAVKPSSEKLTGEQVTEIKTVLTASGVPQTDADHLVVTGATRGDTIRALIAWCKTLPAATP